MPPWPRIVTGCIFVNDVELDPTDDRGSQRLVIAHDYFSIRGGGERLILTAAEALNARLVYGFRTEQSYEDEMFPSDSISLSLPEILRRPAIRPMALALRFAFSSGPFEGFSTRMFSGVAAPFAAKRTAGVKNVYYCHTPPRFVYDQREHFSRGLLKQSIGQPLIEGYRLGFERAMDSMDLIIANSETVRDRIRRFLGRESTVVYPPCNTDDFRWVGQGDFYLSTARLTPLKRVDRIVEAFLKMPQHKLVVASGGSEIARLRSMAEDAKNIVFLDWVSEQDLRDLVGRCIATIYVPVDEDFGMSPVESMAAGKPVIGVAEGGLRETIVAGETGALLPPDFTTSDVASAVSVLTPTTAATMRGACEARAQMFTKAKFVSNLRDAIGIA